MLIVARIAITGLRIKQGRILRADRERKIRLDRMKVDEITQDVSTNRQKKRVSATFKTFEEIRATETDQPFSGTRKVLHDLSLAIRGRNIQGRFDIVRKSIAWEIEQSDSIDNRLGVEFGILVIRIVVPDPEVERLGFTARKMEPYIPFQNKEPPIGFSFGTGTRRAARVRGQQNGMAIRAFRKGIVTFNKTAGSPNHE